MRVFVVEDEFAILLLLEDMLTELGCVIAATASRIPEAMRMLDGLTPDAAVLDVNVAGERVFGVAELLESRRVPIVFSTGYGASGMDANWRDRVILQKPFHAGQLAAALERAMAK